MFGCDTEIIPVLSLAISLPFYFVADAYYASGKVIRSLLLQGNHLITQVRINAVAFHPAPVPKGPGTKGRPKKYGKKVQLRSLLLDTEQIAPPWPSCRARPTEASGPSCPATAEAPR